MRLHLIAIALFSVGLLACAKPTESPVVSQSVDPEKARAFSDALVDDIIHDRRQDIYAKTDKDFQKTFTPYQFNATIQSMFDNYGRPLESVYKMNALGTKVDSGGKKPMRKFWYAAKTSKFPTGYYLFVEVVPNGDSLGTTGFALVTFPGGPPADLQ